MKKEVVTLFLLGMFLILPMISAQEQTQTYSGFDRFIDNVKIFFSAGDNKVKLALEIREKEVNSAIANLADNKVDSANKNIDNALNKLLIVQEKVSSDSADEVGESVKEVVENIKEKNLTETLDRYVLEEEKTQLVAELVVEVNGTEGQTLTREIVRSQNENRNTVRLTIQNQNGEIEEIEVEGGIQNNTAVWEIVNGINEIDKGINEIVVEHTYAEGTTASGGESKWVIEGGEQSVKTGGGENRIDSSSEGEGKGGYAEGTISGGDSGDTNEVVEGDGGEGDYAEGTTAEGVDAGGDGSIGSTPGTNDVAPATDSNDGSSSSDTGSESSDDSGSSETE
jgi:hypothetical protein